MIKKPLIALLILTIGAALFFWRTNSGPAPQAHTKVLHHEALFEAKPDMPMDAAAYWAARLKTPHGVSPVALNLEVKKDVVEKRKAKKMVQPPPFKIEDFGPGNWGGRVRSILVHPDDPDLMLTGGVSGGVWRSTDGGRNWTAQDDFMGSLAIGCMLLDPDDPNIVYLGTGEGFCNGDRMLGWGIYRSTDFGQSWNPMEATLNSDFILVNRLARIPDSNVLLAATLTGIHRSEDLGASWTSVAAAHGGGLGFQDLKVDPSDPQRMYAFHLGSRASDHIDITLTVLAPADIAGSYVVRAAEFGPQLPDVGPITADLAVYQDADGSDLACAPAVNAEMMAGKIALVSRGDCEFEAKVKNAQDAGAIAVIVVNDRPGSPIEMPGQGRDITIPAFMISQFDGGLFRDFSDGLRIALEGTIDHADRYLMRSTDGGQSFVRCDSRHGLPITDILRMEIAVGQDARVYLMVANDNGGTRGLWRSDDGGAHFYQTASSSRFIERQGCYNLIMAVDPTDSDRVFFGAIDVFRTTDGGDTIDQITTWAPGPGQIPHHVHADVHAMAFYPSDPDTLWIGTDGGLFKTQNGGQTFETLNHELRIAQNYGFAVHPDGRRVITGTQDNGSMMHFGDTGVWLKWFGGDGGYCAWDQQEPGYIYGATPYAGLFGSPDMGNSLYSLNLPESERSLFITPFVLDPQDGNRMLVGTDTVLYSDDVRDLSQAQWTAVSPQFNAPVAALAISPHDQSVAWVATTDGLVFKTSGLGMDSAFEPVSGLPENQLPTWIEFDPHDATSQTVFVTFAWYDADRIFRTTDGGMTWNSMHGDLPEIPVFCVSVDPQIPGRLFAGTELGLWVTQSTLDQNPITWSQYDYGTAWTRVVQLKWGDPDTLWVATHGRGMFQAHRQALIVTTHMTQRQGDGDAYLDLRERHVVHVDLQNTTPQTIGPGTVSLTSHRPGLWVLQEPQPHPAVPPGQTQSVPFELVLETLDAPLETASLEVVVTTPHATTQHVLEMTLGADPPEPSDVFADGAEGESALTHSATLGVDGWQRLSGLAYQGSFAWACPNSDRLSDAALATPPLKVTSADAVCSAWLYYNLEGDTQQYWDGAVVELRTSNSDWRDAGHLMTGVPYDGMLFDNNPLFLRQAWSGKQRSWRQVQLNLGAYMGETLQIRFRVGTDRGAAAPRGGFWLDDLVVSGIAWEGIPLPDADPCLHCDGTKGSDLAFTAVLPDAHADAQSSMLMGAVNLAPNQSATVEIFAFSRHGWELGSFETALPAQGKLWMSTQELFPEVTPEIAWVQFGSNRPLAVFGAFVSQKTSSAYWASDGLADTLFLPHVAQDTQRFSTHLSVVNAGPEITQSVLNPSITQSPAIPLGSQHFPYQQISTTAVDLLGDDIQNISWASLQANGPHLAAMESFSVLPDISQTASLGLIGDRGRTLRFLHVATDTSLFWTGMVYFNVSQSINQVTETFFGAQGEILEQTTRRLEPLEKCTLLFDHTTTDGPVPQGTAWIELQGSQDLSGYELFGSSAVSPHDFFAGIQAAFSSGRSIGFPHVPTDDTTWSGLVILNVGNATASLEFDLIGADGTVLETHAVEAVPPKTKRTFLARDLFAQSLLAGTTWIRARADGSAWNGFVLWGDQGDPIRHHLAGIQGFID